MHLDTEYNILFTLDGYEKIINLCEGKWDTNTIRQDSFKVHKDTKSVVLRGSAFEIPLIYKDTEYNEVFKECLLPLIQKLKEHFKFENFDYHKLVIAKLPPGAEIPLHYDSAKSFQLTHRVHWCLSTNNKVDFIINNKKIPFVDGAVIEISNTPDMHYVKNNSTKDRIHLIIDCYNKEIK